MNNDDMILISVDDQIVEPPDTSMSHLSEKYVDDAPPSAHNPDGSEPWQFLEALASIRPPTTATARRKELNWEPESQNIERWHLTNAPVTPTACKGFSMGRRV